MQFNINIEEEQKNFVTGGIRLSPGLFPLTPPFTPNQNIHLSSTQFQPIKNEECNEIVERLTSRINQNMTGNIEHSSDSIPFHSPAGSAFRFYS